MYSFRSIIPLTMAAKVHNSKSSRSKSEEVRALNSRGGPKSSSMKPLNSQVCPGFTTSGKGVVSRVDNNQSDNTRALKKFFHRLKENVGLVERTEFSKELNDAFDNMDNYKLCLDRLGEAVCQVIQGNPKFRKMDHKMELAPPPDEDPYELVSAWLTNSKAFEDYKNFKTQVSLYQKQAIEHREYIRRARRALHNIRTFIQHHYWVVGIHRTELDNLRIEMDFARAELKAAKEPQLVDLKNKLYDQAVRSFEAKLKEVTKLMDAVPKNKESHLADVIEWTNCTRMYHEKMAKLLEET
ncbi:BAR domain-containing protein [Trichostrongylus colubriformis]|uniref:BAR domain-containing protein n=1 Tax=Trichostrongylus colubriformis TaxID=6319 RepID=A0AAN8J3M9_TRICO